MNTLQTPLPAGVVVRVKAPGNYFGWLMVVDKVAGSYVFVHHPTTKIEYHFSFDELQGCTPSGEWIDLPLIDPRVEKLARAFESLFECAYREGQLHGNGYRRVPSPFTGQWERFIKDAEVFFKA